MRRGVALVCVAAFGFGGCGGDDDGPSANETLPDLGSVVPPPSGFPSASTSPNVTAPGDSQPPTTGSTSSSPVTGVAPPPSSAVSSTAPAPTAPLGDPAVTLTPAIAGEGLLKVVGNTAGRTYAVAKSGTVLLVGDDGSTTPVLNLTTEVSTGSEQGLLGLAFHPSLPLAYVNYTDTDGDTVIAEYTVTATGALDSFSARDVLTVDQPFENHNGGNLVFGPDKYMYIGLGDGGSANDPGRVALDDSLLLGKMLRIDPAASEGYNVPADNPFIATDGAAGEVWSIGLRNPWRFSFDPENGDLWIGDVGQGAFEEIDVARATGGFAAGKGLSFGWSAFEGNARLNEDQEETGHTAPYYTYAHEEGRCSISGGVVYRGTEVPALNGWYVFADYCSGEVFAIDVEGDGEGTVVELATVSVPVSVDQVGDTLYVVSATDGALRVEPA